MARLLLPEAARRQGSIERPLAAAMGELERRGAWVATRREISTWTRERAAVEASVRRAGPRRVVVEVTNFGRTPTARLVLRVWLNEPVRRAEAEATKLMQDRATVRLVPNAEVLDLVLPELDERESAAFSLDYEPVVAVFETARRTACDLPCNPVRRGGAGRRSSPRPCAPPSAGSTPSRPRSA